MGFYQIEELAERMGILEERVDRLSTIPTLPNLPDLPIMPNPLYHTLSPDENDTFKDSSFTFDFDYDKNLLWAKSKTHDWLSFPIDQAYSMMMTLNLIAMAKKYQSILKLKRKGGLIN